jgi:GNAT superfamily N-acetyltransferase
VTLSEQFTEIGDRIEKAGVGLKDALSVIDMTFDDQVKELEAPSPYEAFSQLNRLIDRTVHGARIQRFGPREGCRHFHTLEIHTEGGEIIGYLNMLYLKRSIPCYYLVYVEVMPSFRGMGLGNRILAAFMEFVQEKNALGLLDNIIPSEDPTYEIYRNLGWKAATVLIGDDRGDDSANYMVFVPEPLQKPALTSSLRTVLCSLKKRRPVIEMHDNEDMVKRTIEEFRSVYQTLVQLFDDELSRGTSNHLMRFMFTRLTTKRIGFRRGISALIGYTGGESLQQISLSDRIKGLSIQPYSLWHFEKDDREVLGDIELLHGLPEKLTEEPTSFIESLPFYKRPYLSDWLRKAGPEPSRQLTISDLVDLGFDPTRLREFHHEGVDYIFERVPPHFFSSIEKKRAFLKKVEGFASEARFRGAVMQVNQILLTFRDRGNIYILRKRVGGIHSEEALDQLRTVPYLKDLNRGVGVDFVMTSTMSSIREWLRKKFHDRFQQEIDEVAYFFPWDIANNIPRINVDIAGVSLDTLWIA